MNALSTAHAEYGDAVRTDFACRRSAFLDDFAAFEIIASQCLSLFCTEAAATKKAPFGNRLTAFAGIAPSPRLSKERAAALQRLASDMTRLLRIRATVVHAVMEVGRRGDDAAALFRMATDAADAMPIYTLLSTDDFDALRAELAERTRLLNDCLKNGRP